MPGIVAVVQPGERRCSQVASRIRESRRVPRRVVSRAALLALLGLLAFAALAEDVVVLRDGGEVRGKLLSLDEHRAVVERQDGRRTTIPRREIRRIEFGEEERPSLKVLVTVRAADDTLELLLDGRRVASPEELRDGWVDIGPLLADGANLVEAVVHNESGTWAYSWVIDLGGKRVSLSCGQRGRKGCTKAGRSGHERGRLPGGKVWLYVDRAAGTVEHEIDER